MRRRSRSFFSIAAYSLLALKIVSTPSVAAEVSSEAPDWLRAHIGEGDGQIAEPVLRRARDLYRRKLAEGAISNSCYFAMDATRPNEENDGRPGRRFYVICESSRMFRVISAGHGSGRTLPGMADFTNGRHCVKNFGNARDSNLTAGGVYVTAETRSTFKGLYRAIGHEDATLMRSFVQFDGEGETANARKRAIGGHPAVTLKGVCLRRDPGNSLANKDGYVPFGTFVDYSGGRSDGCTSWTPADARDILALIKDKPTTLFIYPDASDVDAIARAISAKKSLSKESLYWNSACLKEISIPKYWSKQTLEPMLARYAHDHPPPPSRPPPLCKMP